MSTLAPTGSSDQSTSSPSPAAPTISPTSDRPTGAAPAAAPSETTSIMDEYRAMATGATNTPDVIYETDEPEVFSTDPLGQKPLTRGPDGKFLPREAPATPAAPAEPKTGLEDLFGPLPETSPAAQNPAAPAARDLSSLPPNIAAVFKQMSNEAYNMLRPIYDQHTNSTSELTKYKEQLAQAAQAQFIAPPNGYQLSPDYTALTKNLSDLQGEAEFWREQKIRVLDKQSWNKLTLDQQTGQYGYSEDQQPSSQALMEIDDKIRKAETLQNDVRTRTQNLQTSFQQEHQKFYEGVNKVQTSLSKYTNHPGFKAKYDGLAALVPPLISQNPLGQGYLTAMVIIDALLTKQQASQAQAAATNLTRAAASQSIPVSQTTSPVAASTDPGPTWDDYKKRLGRSGARL